MGAAFGSLAHEVFERVDPVPPDLDAEIHRACPVALSRTPAEGARRTTSPPVRPWRTVPARPPGHRPAALRPPIGDRLAELTFESGGDTTTAEVTVGMIGAVLRRHLPGEDPLARYADALDDRCSPARCCAAT